MKKEILKRYHKKKNRKLILAVIIDMIGLLSYFIPVLGEWGDSIWAPLSGFMIFLLFPNRKRMAFLGVLEEAMPVTDFIPTAYLTWRQEYVKDKDKTLLKFVENEIGEEHIVDELLSNTSIDSNHLSD